MEGGQGAYAMKLFSHFRPRLFARDKAGATRVEYGIIVTGISVSIIAFLALAGIDVFENLRFLAKLVGII